MLTCIACTKQIAAGAGNGAGGESSLHDSETDDPNDTPNTGHAVKTLTSQIKDMALKASGAYRHCGSKPCSGSTGHHHRSHRYVDSEKFHYSYRRAGEANSSSSTPRVICFGDIRSGRGLSSAEGTPSMSGRTDGGGSCGGLGVFLPDEEVPKEWVAQVEPGVLITFFSLTGGGNDLKRIRFSREMFNKWQAQRWWEENADKVMELYNVQRLNRLALPVPTPLRSEEALPIQNSRLAPTPNLSSTSGGAKTETSSMDASARTTSSSHDELSVSNASDQETEWVEQDEPGVYITIRALPGGAKELRRVRFNRERFGEMHARLWWEENRARIHEQYL